MKANAGKVGFFCRMFITASALFMSTANYPTHSQSSDSISKSSKIETLEAQRDSVFRAAHPTKQQLALLRTLAELYSEQSLLEQANSLLRKELQLRARFDADGLPESWL